MLGMLLIDFDINDIALTYENIRDALYWKFKLI